MPAVRAKVEMGAVEVDTSPPTSDTIPPPELPFQPRDSAVISSYNETYISHWILE